MSKLNGNEFYSVEEANEFMSEAKMKGIRLIIAFVLSLINLVMWNIPSVSNKLFSGDAAFFEVIVSVLIICGCLGKIRYFLSAIRAWARKGWELGRDFHSFILAFILWYCAWAAVVAWVAVIYGFMPIVGVIITAVQFVIDYFMARRLATETM